MSAGQLVGLVVGLVCLRRPFRSRHPFTWVNGQANGLAEWLLSGEQNTGQRVPFRVRGA